MSVPKLEPNGRSAPNPQPNSPGRGRPFEKGNGGRRPGSRNRTSLVAEALLKGEEVELVRKGIELAKAGDTQMLKFLLDRILPKDRSVRIEIPEMQRAGNSRAHVSRTASKLHKLGAGGAHRIRRPPRPGRPAPITFRAQFGGPERPRGPPRKGVRGAARLSHRDHRRNGARYSA